VQGGSQPSHGNIDADPLFVEPGHWDLNGTPDDASDDFWVDGDYHLKSQAGRWDPVGEIWVHDDVTSPCIDAGNPASAFEQEPAPNGGRINIGVYGNTPEASKSTQPGQWLLPRVAYIFSSDAGAAQSFQSLLASHGCSVTLVPMGDLSQTALASYDLVVAGNDTGYMGSGGKDQSIAAVQGCGRPVVGIGEGGYALFGQLNLSIGHPNGGHSNVGTIYVADPDCLLFNTPDSVALSSDQKLQVYTQTQSVSIWLSVIPEGMASFGQLDVVSDQHLIVMEQRYLLWGFTGSPASMTEAGQKLFINAVILAANGAL
jgi:hypothetical protein